MEEACFLTSFYQMFFTALKTLMLTEHHNDDSRHVRTAQLHLIIYIRTCPLQNCTGRHTGITSMPVPRHWRSEAEKCRSKFNNITKCRQQNLYEMQLAHQNANIYIYTYISSTKGEVCSLANDYMDIPYKCHQC